ncbi:MAG TPA: acetate--CoA ligase family protein, partial [Acidimicrobiia bacterium]|nr:acetate--CoA ligase family protein [Acidimicrobiia bacterium]
TSVTDEPRAAITALRALTTVGDDVSPPEPIAGTPETWGIPMLAGELAATPDEAVAAARRCGFPVVMKAEADGLLHKTELGLVLLGITDEQEARSAFEELAARALAAGFESARARVQRWCPGVEVIVGGIVHETLGPMVSVGLGGVMAELISDVVFAPAPLGQAAAGRLIDRLSGRRLLDGFRGAPPADVALLADIVSLVSRGIAAGAVAEFEINPLVWDGEAWVALDWLVA